MKADARQTMKNAKHAMQNAKRSESTIFDFALHVLHFSLFRVAICMTAVGLFAAIPGCSDDSPKGPSAADRAQGDPMSYGPHYGRADIAPKPDSSNDRGGIKRELNDVL